MSVRLISQLAKEFKCNEKEIIEALAKKGFKFHDRMTEASENTYKTFYEMLKEQFISSQKTSPTQGSKTETNTMQVDVKSIVDALGKDKKTFLDDVESSIREHIKDKSWQECLTIVERYSWGDIRSTWEPEVSEAYWDRMVAFVRGKNYKGYQLDSKLTDGVVDLVTEKFDKFYEGHADDLSIPLSQQLMKDQVFSELLAREIIEASKGTLPKTIKKQLVNQLADIIQQTSIGQSLKEHAVAAITTAISTVIATVISSTIGSILLKQMIILLKGVIAKILATTAFKTMIVATIKAIAKAKIIAFLVAIFGSMLGSVPLFVIIAPVLTGFIAYQVATLPDKMSDKVSSAVRQELDGKFNSISKDVVNEVVGSLTSDTIKKLAKDIAREALTSEEFKNSIDGLGR